MKKLFTLCAVFVILLNQFVFSQNNLESKYDVKQYILDLQISNSSAIISGNVIMNARVTAANLDTVAVDLINTLYTGLCYMTVDSVFIDGDPNSFIHENHMVYIPLTNFLSTGEMFSLQVYYHGRADDIGHGGIRINAYDGKLIAQTWSQFYGAKVWWPCKKDLTDKADSVIFYITTDVSNRSGSNGLLISVDTLAGGTKVRYKWVTIHPIDYYLISFAVGPYDEYNTYATLHDGQDSVLMQNILLSDAPDYPFQLKVIEKTKKLIDLYSNLFCDYPFKDEKYGYSIIYGNASYGAGSMENQTMATISSSLMDTTYNHYDIGNWWITAHELGHQWFGDYVTCNSENDVWLNEGFASYIEYTALQNFESQQSADNWMKDAHKEILSQPGGSVYGNVDDRLVYKKGAAIILILRYEINNDSLFFAVLKNYLNGFKDSSASAADFKHIAELTTGLDLTDFFNQWYYGEGYPLYDVTWNQVNDTITITSNQTTSTDTTTLFNTHFDLKINSSTGDTVVRLFHASNHEIFKLYYPGSVDSIEFDPKNWLIKKSSIHLGIEKLNNFFSFRISPNPAKDRVTVELDQQNIAKNLFLSIYNIQGQLMLDKPIFQNSINIDISALVRGVYILKLTNNKNTEVSRFVKE